MPQCLGGLGKRSRSVARCGARSDTAAATWASWSISDRPWAWMSPEPTTRSRNTSAAMTHRVPRRVAAWDRSQTASQWATPEDLPQGPDCLPTAAPWSWNPAGAWLGPSRGDGLAIRADKPEHRFIRPSPGHRLAIDATASRSDTAGRPRLPPGSQCPAPAASRWSARRRLSSPYAGRRRR